MFIMRKALVVGINDYPGSARLHGCVNDANAIGELLSTHGDGSPNFDLLVSTSVRTKAALKSLIIQLFRTDSETCLFYFSGHGCISESGGYIVTPDFSQHDQGVSMDEILALANQSPARNKIILVDCCYSGTMGTPRLLNSSGALIHKGVTILAASNDNEQAIEVKGHGVFTQLLLDALRGGAADISGSITSGNIYAYIDKALGWWKQRPVFKANIVHSTSLRSIKPAVSLKDIREALMYFPSPSAELPLAPSYEYTSPLATESHVRLFKRLQKMERMGLVEPVGEEYMYWAAMHSMGCRLTTTGQYCWNLVKDHRL